MILDKEIKTFLENNKHFIEENTQKGWRSFYDKTFWDRGEITEILLKAGIDPAEKLGCIPSNYLSNSNITSYELPDNISHIGDYAFANCKHLIKIIIPKKILYIGDFPFMRCDNLKRIEYKGTRNQWLDIEKGKFSFFKLTKDIVIKCSDNSILYPHH